jgi:hypothetical protein
MKPFHETVCANRLCKLLDETVRVKCLMKPFVKLFVQTLG